VQPAQSIGLRPQQLSIVSEHILSPPQVFRHAAELVRLLLKSPQPPRVLTSQYLHERKKLSPEVKAAVSSLAFHTLRHLRLAHFVASGDTAEIGMLDTASASACTAAALFLGRERLPSGRSALDEALLQISDEIVQCAGLNVADLRTRITTIAAWSDSGEAEHTAVLHSVPLWIVEMWIRERSGRAEFPRPEALASGLLHPAPLTIRVHTSRVNRDTVLRSLLDAGMHARIHPLLPQAIVLDRREQLLGSDWEGNGLIEIQDAGSQLIGHALAPQPNSSILDACAGAGGKTLQCADALGGSGSITAADVERIRLNALRSRAERLGLRDIETVLVPSGGDLSPVFRGRQFDAVLVDAPCSGFGTARRNPLVKWKLRPRSVHKLADKQYDILLRNAELVRPGGFLLYATCSLLPMENEHVVERFLQQTEEFYPAPLKNAFTDAPLGSILSDPSQSMLTLDPALLDSDGFFIARLRRRS
jgi:16S rRNA (cytosine967-C5)-methyltransferase